ncbi:MAG TPA: WecB/TagA/CpsF family glycosyltransferase [Acidobacteriaceae bacterium]|nr:WecB/TagA/CpsF family glycosyltransferase [Acidobacteriaceae bacterium]
MRTEEAAPPAAAADTPRPRVNVLGVGIDAVDLPRAVEAIASSIARRDGGYVCVTGVHGVMESQRDPTFRRILNESLVTTPDGMPMVWVGRARGFTRMRRVYGPDLMLELCRRSRDAGFSHFLYGGIPGVAGQLAQRLIERFPGLRVLGTYTPPFRPLTDAEEDALVQHITALRPDIIWVGLSTPRQERFMARLAPRVAPAVMIGVGAAFDFHTGRVRQAPRWMQQCGLEWLFRAIQEPRRLGPRYARNNVPFIFRILLQSLGVGRYSLE